ncbi:MAG: Zn-ribbon domain-containing OB-fold protein [Porticoccaceae bacterium]
MTVDLQPIAPDLWSDEAEPHLLAGQDSDGKIHFPIPEGDSGKNLDIIKLSRKGTLWSFTRQDFRPKPPYDGPEEFTPFLLGYIELPGQVIVESHIVGTSLEELEIGMAMEFVITPFDDKRSTFAFRPEQNS